MAAGQGCQREAPDVNGVNGVFAAPEGRFLGELGRGSAFCLASRLFEQFLEVVVAGGMNNEGPVLETRLELKKYKFKVVGFDVNKMLHRHVRFDTVLGIIKVDRNKPFLKKKSTRYFNLSRR